MHSFSNLFDRICVQWRREGVCSVSRHKDLAGYVTEGTYKRAREDAKSDKTYRTPLQ